MKVRKKSEKRSAKSEKPLINNKVQQEVVEPDRLFAFTYEGAEYNTSLTKKFTARKPYSPPNPRKVSAFIPGTIVKLYVKEKEKIKKGDNLLSLQAMKMNNNIVSAVDGTVKKIHVKKGEVVVKNQLLVEIR